MKLEIFVFRDEDLIEEDASLSLGWFSFKEKGMEISFFKEGLCMVFLTLTSLLEIMQKVEMKKGEALKWVGEDNGAIAQIYLKDKNLWMSMGDSYFVHPFTVFKKAVLSSINNFLIDCMTKNKSIVNESAFKDLELTYKEFE